MNFYDIIILVFIMSAFAVGVGLNESSQPLINSALDNASITINNITLEKGADVYTNGLLNILESFIHFIGTSFTEVMRLGIMFGAENPQYFTTEFILSLVKLILWLVIISLLIKPLFYLVVFIIMGLIYLRDKLKSKKK